ncbi:TetR/AcrR family transcriptional regulator [Oerskovia flava]|uniref:TetR/AcrR family transcriptional regulator n=1 Tax=Oerskovia flava TaxID=2986422 RepID=UPI00223F6964|nr:TetR family transcriptional regulator [Oerskovia sp. JB1-3-2]
MTPSSTASSAPRRQARGTQRRDAIVAAAVELILRDGPAGLSHRTVAAHADVPLAATTYYFTGLDDLVAAAGARIAAGWADHARAVVEGLAERRAPGAVPLTEGERAELLVRAVLPQTGVAKLRGFYEHLVAAGRHEALARAYADGRQLLDDAIAELLAELDVDLAPALLVAVVDGAAVSALSEGRDVRDLAAHLVSGLLATAGRPAQGA